MFLQVELMAMGSVKNFTVFADYFQVFVYDKALNFSQITIGANWWTGNDQEYLLSEKFNNQLIVVGTVRDFDVPIIVYIERAEPLVNLDAWDQVIECSINISSGQLCIGEQFDEGNTHIFYVEPGIWQMRVLYGGLFTLSEDGIEGDDKYEIHFWPIDKVESLKLIKIRKSGAEN